MNTWLQTLHESTCGRNTGQDVVDTDASRECGAKKKGSMYQSATSGATQTQPLFFFFCFFFAVDRVGIDSMKNGFLCASDSVSTRNS
jgi:hypothetical protein